ncbi:MAG: rod shape-determining protein MreC [Candidatus Paceibacterota bacterium]
MVKRRKNRKTIIVISAIVLVFLLFFFFEAKTKEYFYLLSSNFQKSIWAISKDFYGFVEKKKELENLRSENAFLLQKIESAKLYEAENRQLRTALSLEMEKEYNLLLSSIVAKKISDDILIIDKGKLDGVSTGMPVVTAEKALVGKIGETYDYFSEVYLASKKDFSFDVIVNEDIFAISKGLGNLKLGIDLIPPSKKPETGEIVLTSGTGGIFPKGLLVGKIETIEKSDTDFYFFGNISPFFKLERNENLFIIDKPIYDF